MLSVLFQVLVAAFMLATLGAIAAAVFAGADRAEWSGIQGVVSYPGIQRIEAAVVGSAGFEQSSPDAVTAPHSGRQCAWFTVWASAKKPHTTGDFERQRGGRELVLLTRSNEPVLFSVRGGGAGTGDAASASGAGAMTVAGAGMVAVDGSSAWVEPASGDPSYEPAHPSMPLGGGPVHRGTRVMPGLHRTWKSFAADSRVGPSNESTAISEVRLEPGDQCELYGVAAPPAQRGGPTMLVPPPGHAGVVVLRAGSAVPALLAARLDAVNERVSSWRRVAMLAGAGFVISLIAVVAAG